MKITKNIYYYTPEKPKKDNELSMIVKEVFEQNKGAYGQKKLYKALRNKGISIGKEKLSKIRKEEQLVSKYTKRRRTKRAENAVNTDETGNKLQRNFNGKKALEVVVSDLTYVEINHQWHYTCLLIELGHREIIGFATAKNKDAELVKMAWLSVKEDVRKINIFHTDRGGEYKNEDIDELLKTFNIERSLSNLGTPIDNAVCESMYDIVKTEFIFEENFKSLADLQSKLSGERIFNCVNGNNLQ